MTVASFIEINARQSPSTTLRWLAPPLKGAFVQKRNVRCLHRTEEPNEHPFEQVRQLVQNLAAAQILDVMGHDLDPQYASSRARVRGGRSGAGRRSSGSVRSFVYEGSVKIKRVPDDGQVHFRLIA
jgi:hypothetical protein